MYLNHWKLRHSPFQRAASVDGFYEGSVQEEALARLKFLVQFRRPLGVLVGPSGSGKSLVLDVFAQRLQLEAKPFVRLGLQGADWREFLWQLAAKLDLNPSLEAGEFLLWRKIKDYFAQIQAAERDMVLILDDVDDTAPECQLGLVRLLAANRCLESRLTMVVATRPETVGQLSPRLLELAELRVQLDPMPLADVASYLYHHLSLAGREESAFSNAAIVRLQEISGGLPRKLNHLAELSLVAAASQGLACVDTEVVDGAAREMSSFQTESARAA